MSTHRLGRLLVVDDEVELTTALCDGLIRRGYEAVGVTSGKDALDALKTGSFDLLLTDLMMPDLDGIALLRAALELDPHIIGIIMTGQGTVQTAVEAMKTGSFDYILKPFKLERLLPLLTRAIEVRRLRLDNIQLRETLAIYELCQTIAHTLDMDTLLNKTADAVLQQLEADNLSIMLPTREGNELYVATVRGAGFDKPAGSRIPLAQGITGWVEHHRKILPFEGEAVDALCVVTPPGSDTVPRISLPMLIGGKLLGILNVSSQHLRPFTLGQIKGLSILAGTAAAALESAGLYTQLREAEEKYRSIFENAVEGIFQSRNGRFMIVNPAMAHMLGYESPAELTDSVADIGRQLFPCHEQFAEFRKLVEEQGGVSGFEFQAGCKDGSAVWVSMNARCVRDSSGAPLYYEGIVQNINERKRAEEALKSYSAKLEQSNRELQDFAFIASHDLQEPVRKIQTFADRLNARYHELPDEKGRDYLERIGRSARRMQDLILDLLKYSRVTSQSESFPSVDLRGSVEEAVSDLQVLRDEAQAQIEIGMLPTIEADPVQMRQLFQNLLSNSLKYRGENRPDIRIYSEPDPCEGFCEIRVQDNGIGFDECYLDSIFKPFQRLHGKSAPYKGTGMGLAICRKIVERHGGSITARSKPEGGAVFMVRLPERQS